MNKPFIAVVENGPYGPDWNVRVYLVNPTQNRIKATLQTGAFASDEDNLIDLGNKKHPDTELDKKSFRLIDQMNDGGELDFTTWYRFEIEMDNKTELLNVSLNSRTLGRLPQIDLPILNQKGIILN